MSNRLQLSPEDFKALKNAYVKAVSEGAESFHPPGFPGPLLTSYAKYLIEYVSPFFGEKT